MDTKRSKLNTSFFLISLHETTRSTDWKSSLIKFIELSAKVKYFMFVLYQERI